MSSNIGVFGEDVEPEERTPNGHRVELRRGVDACGGGGVRRDGGKDIVGVVGGEIDGGACYGRICAEAADNLEDTDEVHTSEEQDECGEAIIIGNVVTACSLI